MEPKSPAESVAVMTQMILPSDANPLNAAFGGRVLEWIDICGAIAASRHCRHAVVTASMDDLHFHKAIRVGWVVTLRARVLAAFRSSMEVGVRVTAENPLTGENHLTTTALITFVALESDGSRAEVPPLALKTDAERAAFQAAHARRRERLDRKGHVLEWQRLLEQSAD
jgi:acyl-CoA hydrolase